MAQKDGCHNCTFYVAENTDCRRYPKTANQNQITWKAADWCGEHKPKPKKSK